MKQFPRARSLHQPDWYGSLPLTSKAWQLPYRFPVSSSVQILLVDQPHGVAVSVKILPILLPIPFNIPRRCIVTPHKFLPILFQLLDAGTCIKGFRVSYFFDQSDLQNDSHIFSIHSDLNGVPLTTCPKIRKNMAGCESYW